MNGENQKKEQAKEDAKKRLWRDIERVGDNDLVPDPEGYEKMQEIFDKTVAHAIDTWDETEWTRNDARKFIRRHVALIARVAKNLAKAAKRDYLAAQDIEDAADLIIRRAKVSCTKTLTDQERDAFGHPCSGY